MWLALILGIGAFIILGIMFALLGLSARQEYSDPVTEEIILRAAITVRTQEESD